MRRYPWAVPCAALLVLACGDGDPVGPGTEGDWLPLAVGNQWVYAVEEVWVVNDTDADTTFVTGVNILTLAGQTTHADGFGVFILQDSTVVTVSSPDSTFLVTTSLTNYLQATDEGVWAYPDTFTSYTVHELDLPLVTGTFWQPFPGTPAAFRTVTSTSVDVTLPAGTFTGCAQLTDVDPEAPTWTSSRLYARGVGMVQSNEAFTAAEWEGLESRMLVSCTVE